MASIDDLRSRLDDASRRLRGLTDRYNEATGARDEIQREVRQLRARRDRIREEGRARALLPEMDAEAAVAVAEEEAEDLDARLQEAERAARGRHVKGFGFHAFRRRWANKVGRKLPPATAAKLGGWKDASVMQTVYERLPDLEETAEALAWVAEAGGAG